MPRTPSVMGPGSACQEFDAARHPGVGEVYGIDELEAEMQRPGPGGREPVVPRKAAEEG